MFEGQLFASATPGGYAIGTVNGPDLVNGQAIDLLLGGRWITGRIQHSKQSVPATGLQHNGTYNLNREQYDTVMEASEESFPASDSPAWSASSQVSTPPATDVTDGYHFVADEGGTICGICVGMQIRTH